MPNLADICTKPNRPRRYDHEENQRRWKESKMRVGVPKEIKVQEYRVGLTPGAVREYVAAGHQVAVETGAGSGIGASDEVYRRAGAAIAGGARDIFANGHMVVKVKEPEES